MGHCCSGSVFQHRHLQPMAFIKAKEQQVIALLVHSLSNLQSCQTSGWGENLYIREDGDLDLSHSISTAL